MTDLSTSRLLPAIWWVKFYFHLLWMIFNRFSVLTRTSWIFDKSSLECSLWLCFTKMPNMTKVHCKWSFTPFKKKAYSVIIMYYFRDYTFVIIIHIGSGRTDQITALFKLASGQTEKIIEQLVPRIYDILPRKQILGLCFIPLWLCDPLLFRHARISVM